MYQFHPVRNIDVLLMIVIEMIVRKCSDSHAKKLELTVGQTGSRRISGLCKYLLLWDEPQGSPQLAISSMHLHVYNMHWQDKKHEAN